MIAGRRPAAVSMPLFVSLFLTACGGSANVLEGSIDESFSLEFDNVRIRKQEQDLIIEYLKEVAGGTNKVCKLVLETANLGLKNNTVVEGDVFLERAVIDRITSTGERFPDPKGGLIKFDVFQFSQGGQVKGEFDVLFENGRTLHGEFQKKVEEVVLDA